MLAQIQTNMEHLTWFLKCGNPPWVNVFLLFFELDRPSLDKDRPAKFEFFDFKFTRSLAQMTFFFFFFNWEYVLHSDLLSTLSLALLERRAASVAWHSYRESSDSWALEISRLYWPMSRERSTRYLGQAAGDTFRTSVKMDDEGEKNSNSALTL